MRRGMWRAMVLLVVAAGGWLTAMAAPASAGVLDGKVAIVTGAARGIGR